MSWQRILGALQEKNDLAKEFKMRYKRRMPSQKKLNDDTREECLGKTVLKSDASDDYIGKIIYKRRITCQHIHYYKRMSCSRSSRVGTYPIEYLG